MSCRCFGEGVGPVDERFNPAVVPEGENGLEFVAEDRDLPPQVADVDAADGPVVVTMMRRNARAHSGMVTVDLDDTCSNDDPGSAHGGRASSGTAVGEAEAGACVRPGSTIF